MTDTPQVNLETYMIVPFEIISRHKGEIDFDLLTKRLEDDWETLKGHELDVIDASLIDAAHKKNIYYQAYNYFHPFVRDYWFNPSQVKRYRHTKLAKLHSKVKYYGTHGKEVKEVEFEAVCDLLHFTPNIGMLVLHLKHNHLDLKPRKPVWINCAVYTRHTWNTIMNSQMVNSYLADISLFPLR